MDIMMEFMITIMSILIFTVGSLFILMVLGLIILLMTNFGRCMLFSWGIRLFGFKLKHKKFRKKFRA